MDNSRLVIYRNAYLAEFNIQDLSIKILTVKPFLPEFEVGQLVLNPNRYDIRPINDTDYLNFEVSKENYHTQTISNENLNILFFGTAEYRWVS